MDATKQTPDCEADALTQLLADAVADAYQNPVEGEADEAGHPSLNRLAEEFRITPLKARKLLVTAGVYETEKSRTVNALHQSGKTVPEIQALTGLSQPSVSGYLPYTRQPCRITEAVLQSPGLERYRARLAAETRLRQALAQGEEQAVRAALWDALVQFAGYPFRTAKGLRFSYTVKGGELFFTRKEKSVTSATVYIALDNALALQRQGLPVTGPKKLNCFGASYLYPVLIRVGVIQAGGRDIP
ncbi:MAG: hypothetical protein LUC48_02740 [Clostridiales bacterium]|nr:hypothetical protein [Clostridiales bacterium]